MVEPEGFIDARWFGWQYSDPDQPVQLKQYADEDWAFFSDTFYSVSMASLRIASNKLALRGR